MYETRFRPISRRDESTQRELVDALNEARTAAALALSEAKALHAEARTKLELEAFGSPAEAVEDERELEEIEPDVEDE